MEGGAGIFHGFWGGTGNESIERLEDSFCAGPVVNKNKKSFVRETGFDKSLFSPKYACASSPIALHHPLMFRFCRCSASFIPCSECFKPLPCCSYDTAGCRSESMAESKSLACMMAFFDRIGERDSEVHASGWARGGGFERDGWVCGNDTM